MNEPADIPQDADDKGPSDLVAAAKLPAEFLKKFLDLLEDKVANPEDYVAAKITIGELRFLEKHRPELFYHPEDAKTNLETTLDNDICESQEELRNRIMIHFQNPDKTSKLRREIAKSEMSDWTKSKRLNGVPPPPPPIEGGRTQRRSLRAWIEWFEKYMLWSDEFRPEDSHGDGRKDSRVMPMGELEQVTKREHMEHDRFKIQEEMGRFLAVTVAARIAGGRISQYHNLWKAWIEKRMVDEREADLQSLNIEPGKISVAKERDIIRAQNFVDAVESASEKFAGELDEKLKAEIKKENDRRA